jgi:hypothetical protein
VHSQWRRAESLHSSVGYEDFLLKHAEGVFADSARLRIEQLAFERAESINTVLSYNEFLTRYKVDGYAARAESAVEALTYRSFTARNSIESYREFVRLHPSSPYVAKAQAAIEQIAWERASEVNTRESYTSFLREYPDGEHASAANRGLEQLDWNDAKQIGTVEACDNFLKSHPSGQLATEVARFRDNMVAEQRSGRLIGFYAHATGIPAGYEMARIVPAADSTETAIFMGDIWIAYPYLSSKYRTDLERSTFVQSATADSLRRDLALRKAKLQDTGALAIKVFPSSGISTYDISSKSFVIDLDEASGTQDAADDAENVSCFSRKLEHVVQGYWFERLPLRVTSQTLFGWSLEQALVVQVRNQERALDIERRRENTDIWTAFHLTGNVRSIQWPRWGGPYDNSFSGETGRYLETKDAVLLLVDRATGEVMWASQ